MPSDKAGHLMGVNLSGVQDWSYDRMFADAMKSARRPSPSPSKKSSIRSAIGGTSLTVVTRDLNVL